MLYLVFRHPTELAALMHELWNTIFYNRVTEAMLDVSVSAIFISAEAGGMENEPLEEVFGAEFQYPKVFFTLNLIKLTPVCFIESMTTTVERKGIVRITKVAFVSQMLNKLHDHVCLDFSWPDGVSYTTMLMSAMFSYSMFSDYQFEHAYEAPIGLDCTPNTRTISDIFFSLGGTRSRVHYPDGHVPTTALRCRFAHEKVVHTPA